MNKLVTKYMHTLNGRPAYYVTNEQIYYAQNGVKLSELLVDSLEIIRKHENSTNGWRKRQGMRINYAEHGYMRIRVQEGSDAS